MPPKKSKKIVHVSPSGKKWTAKAKAAYYASDGFTKPVKKKTTKKKK